jgi:hypothetical protein
MHRPSPEADGHNGPRLVDEAVPGVAAVIDDVGVGGEHAARQPGLAQELPDVLDGVQFGRSGWQQHQREIVWHDEVLGAVPSGPVHQHDPMGSGSHGLRDFRQMQAHRLCVALGHDQGCALALLGADRPEDVDRACPLIMRGAGPGSPPGPAAGDLVLLADTGLVLPPQFYGSALRETRLDPLQLGREVF